MYVKRHKTKFWADARGVSIDKGLGTFRDNFDAEGILTDFNTKLTVFDHISILYMREKMYIARLYLNLSPFQNVTLTSTPPHHHKGILANFIQTPNSNPGQILNLTE